MKSCNEVASTVFLRRNEYENTQRRKQDIYRRISTVVSSVAIVLVLMTSVGTCYVLAVNNGLIDDFLGILQTTVIEYQVNENGEIIYPMPDWGIAISAADVTTTGMTLNIAQSGGDTTNTLITGPDFYLEVHTNNRWEVMPEKDGGNVWDYYPYSIPLNGAIEFKIDWSNIYGELSPGTYRLCKSVSNHFPTEDGQSYTYSIEFTISNQQSTP